jgi:hypothetical protein
MLHGETEKVCKLAVYNRLVVIRKAGAQIRIIVRTKHGLNIDIIVAQLRLTNLRRGSNETKATKTGGGVDLRISTPSGLCKKPSN